jgi:hypothetical protein
MVGELLERRALELTIRRAEAEEHLLERRLDHLALDLWRVRREIEATAPYRAAMRRASAASGRR